LRLEIEYRLPERRKSTAYRRLFGQKWTKKHKRKTYRGASAGYLSAYIIEKPRKNILRIDKSRLNRVMKCLERCGAEVVYVGYPRGHARTSPGRSMGRVKRQKVAIQRKKLCEKIKKLRRDIELSKKTLKNSEDSQERKIHRDNIRDCEREIKDAKLELEEIELTLYSRCLEHNSGAIDSIFFSEEVREELDKIEEESMNDRERILMAIKKRLSELPRMQLRLYASKHVQND